MDDADRLAEFVVEQLGNDLARDVFRALAHPEVHHRAQASAGLYWHNDQSVWRLLDRVLVVSRYEITRRATLVGLARRFHVAVPRLTETDPEYARRRTRDDRLAFISAMYLRDDGQALAEVLADIEQDLTGKTRERLIAGLHAALD